MENTRNPRRKRSREYLKPSEVEALLSVAKTTSRNAQRDYVLLLLMYRHGLRVSEVTALRVADVDLESGTLYVRRLKSGESNLHPLHNGEGAAVRVWLLEREKMNVPETVQELFISERRQALSRRTVWVMIGQLAKAAGLEHLAIHPHMMRHACGFSLVNRSVDLRTIQSYLGHRAIASTTKYTALDGGRFAKLF